MFGILETCSLTGSTHNNNKNNKTKEDSCSIWSLKNRKTGLEKSDVQSSSTRIFSVWASDLKGSN